MSSQGVGGTVTFLVTDVEGSTRRWADDAAAMSEAMAVHDELLRRVVGEHGGELFKHTGDGICAAFSTALAARAAAEAAQAELGLPVRMGLHTGVAERRDGDWFGTDVNRACRIADAAHGGQVVCSDTTAALLAADDVVELGRFRLKGLDRAQRILQVGSGSFPPLRAGATTVRLPAPGVELVGRDGLLRKVADLVAVERLVTLLGPGGVGKTRLAVEAARRRTGTIDRIAFVDLTVADDAASMVAAFARALEARVSSAQAVVELLASMEVLLVVDNCEHVVEDVAELIEDVLAGADGVRVLATSREVLEVNGERLVPVPPLADDADLVALFARAAGRVGSEVDDADHAAVVELCRRLDGLPLAIELAAARTTVFTAGDLLDRLDQRLQLLAAGRRRSRDRHQTMLATIEWSHDLLDDDDKLLYSQLSVFVDWFDVADACAVAGRAELDVADGIGRLVAKSLLVVDERSASRRFRYLESIRDHAFAQLRAGDGHAPAMDAMARRVADRIRSCTDAVLDDDLGALDELAALALHQRQAARWAVDGNDIELGRRLVEPYLELLTEVFLEPYAPARGFVEAAQRAGVIPDPVMRAVDLYERVYRLERGVWRAGLSELERDHGSLEELPEAARVALFFGALVVGDEETFDRTVAAWPLAPRTSAPTFGGRYPVGPEEVADAIAEVRASNAPRLWRAARINSVAIAVQEHDRPDLWAQCLELTDLVIEWLPEWSDLHTTSLLVRIGLHRLLGDARASAQYAEASIRLYERRHRGVYGNFVPPLVGLLVLARDLDLQELAARLRGRVPRRWSIYFQYERDAVNAWCDSILDAPTRERLAEEGRSMDLFELVEQAVDEIEAAVAR